MSVEETMYARRLRVRRAVRRRLAAEVSHLLVDTEFPLAWPDSEYAIVQDEMERQVARLERYGEDPAA